MSNKVLATLADKNYLDQAKALFSGAHFKGGWDGDYLLLAYDIKDQDLQWFKDKGIFIKHCKPLDEYRVDRAFWGHIFLTKLYLFQEDIKKWDKVLYLDTDSLIRGDIGRLTNIKRIAGIPFYNTRNAYRGNESNIIFDGEKISFRELFISGLYCFNTSLIKSDTFENLLTTRDKLYEEFPQGVYNMGNDEIIYRKYFGKNFKRLPIVFNVVPIIFGDTFNIPEDKLRGIVIHLAHPFAKNKPWNQDSYFYSEWKSNFDKADEIDVKKPVKNVKKWSFFQALTYEIWLKYFVRNKILFMTWSLKVIRKTVWLIDRMIGLLGLQIKKYFPDLYEKIKKK